MTHIINRLQFELTCPDEEQAFSFRHNFDISFGEQIAEAVDAICSKYVSEEEWLRIDKLEINLGSFSPAAFELQFNDIFKHKFEKELSAKFSNISPTEKIALRQLSQVQLLQYFLQTGSLPWWTSESDINMDELSIEMLTHQRETMVRFFYQQQNNNNVWTRIAFQLDNEVKAMVVLLIDELKMAQATFSSWMQQLNLALPDETLVDIVLKKASPILKAKQQETALLQILNGIITDVFPDKQAIISQAIVDNETTLLEAYATIAADKVKEDDADKKNRQPGIISKSDLSTEAMVLDSKDEEEAIEKHLVKHAGIVLLAPFFKSFFTNLHLLNGADWKDKYAQYKAIHLLSFLSTGEQKIHEYSLTLEKIICGLHWQEPLPLTMELDETETREAIELLQSVIGHWQALKHTSINGLRESFLKRDGLLMQKENDWLLQVERKTSDVLIDSIPWGCSTLSFPWNDNVIFVEW